MASIKLSAFTQLVNQHSLRTVPYNRVLGAVMSGQIPATLKGSRWWIDEAVVPDAVEYFAKVRTNARHASMIEAGAAP